MRDSGEKGLGEKGSGAILFGSIVAHVTLDGNWLVECVRQGGDDSDELGLEWGSVGIIFVNCAAAIGHRLAGAHPGWVSQAVCSLSFARWASSSSSSARPLK